MNTQEALERVASWRNNPSIRPTPKVAREVGIALASEIAEYPSDQHLRPIKLETCIYADSQDNLVHALEVLLSNAKRDDFLGNGKISGVSTGAETRSVIRVKK